MFGICRSQQLRRVLIITLPFGKRVRTRTVRHSAWCRCHRRSWSRMMTSSRSRTTTCADTGMAVASVAAAAAHSTTIFISASSVSPGARGDAGVAKMFPEANPRRRVPCPRPPAARGHAACSYTVATYQGIGLSEKAEQPAHLVQNHSPSRSAPADLRSYRCLRPPHCCQTDARDRWRSDISQHW